MSESVCHAVGVLLLVGRRFPLRRRRLLSCLVLSVEGFAGATDTAVEDLSQLSLLPFADSRNPEHIPVEGRLAPLSAPSRAPAILEVVVEVRAPADSLDVPDNRDTPAHPAAGLILGGHLGVVQSR